MSFWTYGHITSRSHYKTHHNQSKSNSHTVYLTGVYVLKDLNLFPSITNTLKIYKLKVMKEYQSNLIYIILYKYVSCFLLGGQETFKLAIQNVH